MSAGAAKALTSSSHFALFGLPAVFSLDLEMLEKLCDMVKHTSLCGLGQTAPNPTLSTLRYFRDEYLAHIEDHVCPAGVCAMEGAPVSA